ncbi:PEP-utilizing enzyme [Maribacter litopenaei]|uniref:PEP-utilizing enzyme n=1 Tax=Maribacter litopenaei TaxID=2976127 RepID=UPI003083FD7D
MKEGKLLVKGDAVGSKIKIGYPVLLNSPNEAGPLTKECIIVTDTITPDWDPLLKKVGGIITNKGGRTSHAAIVARELGVPAIVGCGNATEKIVNGEIITMSCAQGKIGYIYRGELPFKERKIDFTEIHLPKTEAKMILADPENAFQLSFYPNNGIGLLRMEFIITHSVRDTPYGFGEI